MTQRIGLKEHVTGLPFIVWLRGRHENEDDNVIVEITPDEKYTPVNAAAFVIEPSLLMIRGEADGMMVDKLSQFVMKNQDTIESLWWNEIESGRDLVKKISKVSSSRYY